MIDNNSMPLPSPTDPPQFSPLSHLFHLWWLFVFWIVHPFRLPPLLDEANYAALAGFPATLGAIAGLVYVLRRYLKLARRLTFSRLFYCLAWMIVTAMTVMAWSKLTRYL
ncbi:hypothetical protein QTH91_14495 [Variovorax dokdonensis]|uniref:Uncharacterized protein n=1 Tax=Variovorax dokdonensis TaxID=344883 RepID=A0ABT7NCQ0_9BURK|nr:hypothetical protein [Variovorax dokdonensis]MDM0045696.1 hypothetical protein [Variovorax dokdonensis]